MKWLEKLPFCHTFKVTDLKLDMTNNNNNNNKNSCKGN